LNLLPDYWFVDDTGESGIDADARVHFVRFREERILRLAFAMMMLPDVAALRRAATPAMHPYHRKRIPRRHRARCRPRRKKRNIGTGAASVALNGSPFTEVRYQTMHARRFGHFLAFYVPILKCIASYASAEDA